MGRVTTPKYTLVIDGMDLFWDVKRHGKPTDTNVEKYVMSYAKSLEIGGCNEHISKLRGYIPYPRKAEVKYNYLGGSIVASWKAGLFQIYS